MKFKILIIALLVGCSFSAFSQAPLSVEPDGSVMILIDGVQKTLTEYLNPVGTVISYAGGTIPQGWLLCDGKAYSSAAYPALAAVLGTAWGDGSTGTGGTSGDFNVPDMRGQFLRGVDAGAGIDTDAAGRVAQAAGGNAGDTVGTKQADQANSLHQIQYTDGGGLNLITIPDSGWSSWMNSAGYTGGDRAKRYLKKGVETRPVNVAVQFIIKY